ncbi:sensor histidine kinase [Winogradskyella marincola]|uniref:histidine kinase n=1 Tax=Winogradskyella marincola TaxID=3037795 RepID=A0ABT6G0E6_9FLAO|nr:sensor histidine kinase [Winogradskyella sp. YYF002]MDG4715412.1 sensor histidine kinase [Winogradskyella sp. YYF002]
MENLLVIKYISLFISGSSTFVVQNGKRIISTEAERNLIVYMIIVLLVICTLVILFFVIYQKRKNQLLLKNIEQQKQFDEELIKTQQEIQEQTLKNVGRELHDNVGQLLAFATMQMNSVYRNASEDLKPKVDNASEALKESLAEVRALSKSLNSDVMQNLGFKTILENEINRLNKSGLIEATFNIEGENHLLENKKDEIILFRIIQEFLSNTLKYAEAETLKVYLEYATDKLKIKVEDDGVGFDLKSAEQGSGMTNMKKRAELIEAEFNLESEPDKGTVLTITYPYRSV